MAIGICDICGAATLPNGDCSRKSCIFNDPEDRPTAEDEAEVAVQASARLHDQQHPTEERAIVIERQIELPSKIYSSIRFVSSHAGTLLIAGVLAVVVWLASGLIEIAAGPGSADPGAAVKLIVLGLFAIQIPLALLLVACRLFRNAVPTPSERETELKPAEGSCSH